jgi:hypothetical protein
MRGELTAEKVVRLAAYARVLATDHWQWTVRWSLRHSASLCGLYYTGMIT